jgi:long-chain fatty acid transport protein
MRSRSWLQILAMALLALFSAAPPAAGSGFALYEMGARASALGGAMVARADDPSALFFNPAGITQLPGLQFMAGFTAIMPTVEIDTHLGPLTQVNNMRETPFFPPHLYGTYQLSPRVWLGMGIFAPFGLGVEFSPTWPGRINNIKTSISSMDLNPTIAVKVNDQISLAAGLDVMYFNFYMRRDLPLPLLGFQDTSLKGDSWGVGANVGVHFKPADFLAIGVSYRSQVKQTVGADAKFAPAAFLNADASGSIILPDMILAGVMFKPIPRLSLEVGCIWTHWGLFHQLDFKFNNPLGTLSEPKKWHDAWRWHLGAEYRVNDWLDLRAGYIFDQEPMSDLDADFIVPTSDRHFFCVGPGFRWRQFTLDLSYSYMFMGDLDVKVSRALGFVPATYSDRHAHLVGATLGYKF